MKIGSCVFFRRTSALYSARFKTNSKFENNFREIDSIKDSTIVKFRDLREINGRKQFKEFLMEDINQIQQAFEAKLPITNILVTQETSNKHHNFFKEMSKFTKVNTITNGIMKKIFTEGRLPEVVAASGFKTYNIDDFKHFDNILVMDNIQDSGNLGTIFRTAKAFGVEGIILLGKSLHEIYDRKMLRSSKGACLTLPMVTSSVDDIDKFCKKHGHNLIATSPCDGENIDNFLFKNKILLIIGNETIGINTTLMKLANKTLKIPMPPATDSLNVSVATGIFLYEMNRQKKILLELEPKETSSATFKV